jgi:membrane fusion protein, multidrug efflux system
MKDPRPGASRPVLPVLLVPLVLCVLWVLSLSACHRAKEQAAAQAPPPAVVIGPTDAAVVTRGTVSTGPTLTGTLTAQRAATLRSQIAGSVLETFAEPGSAVRAGQLLARLDATSLQDAVASARSPVTNARNSLAVAQREEERQRVLVAAGAVAERNVETAHQQVVGARAALAQAESQLASAEKQLGNTRVTAPFAGVVSERQASPGDVVQPGTALYTVVDPSSLELVAAVPAEQIGQLHPGAPVTFTVTGYAGRSFEGTITRINPSADPATRQVRVYAALPNTGGNLVAGLYAEGRVAALASSGLVAPAAAIDRRMSKPAVLRVKDGKVERVEVELGISDEEAKRVEIRRGVEAGDVLLMGAAQTIAPGTPVELTPAVRQQAERLAKL